MSKVKPPDANRFESVLVILAIALTPFWFLTFFGVNLGPADLLLLAAGTSYVFRTKTYPQIPSKLTLGGVLLFLLAGTIGVVNSPVPVAAFLQYLQYFFIFLVVVPITYAVINSPKRRWQGFVALYIVLNLILLTTAVEGLILGTRLREITFWYGNQNQLYWLVASAVLFNIAILFDCQTNWYWRGGSLILALSGIFLVVGGITLSAILLIGAGAWLIVGGYAARRRRVKKRGFGTFFSLTVICIVAGLLFVVTNWEFVYLQGSLEARSMQYQNALKVAMKSQPFGTGLESSEIVKGRHVSSMNKGKSIHNFILAYLVELGVVGLLGFFLILFAWARRVVNRIFIKSNQIRAFSFGPIAIFGGYIAVMLFQPVPVRRFWWVMFAISWSTIYGVLDDKEK